MTIARPNIFSLCLITIVLSLTACGGGGGGNKTSTTTSSLSSQETPKSSSVTSSILNSSSSQDINSPTSSNLSTSSTPQTLSSSSSHSSLASLEPTASILFPPLNAFTEGSSVLVRGTAGDADGTIASLNVNGVQATSNDGFATWSVHIPLTAGSNSLSITVTDNTGVTNQNPIEQKITYQAANFHQPAQMVFDVANNRALVLDDSYNYKTHPSIIAVNLDTGAQTLLSGGASIPVDLMFSSPSNMTLDIAGNRLIVLDWNGLTCVDLTTGKRSRFTLGNLPDTTQISYIQAIVFDNVNSKLWMWTSQGLVAVNSSTGSPTIVTDTVQGNANIEIENSMSIQIDDINQRLIVAGSSNSFRGLVGIDMNSGDRTIISDNNTPNASNLANFSGRIAIDPSQHRIFMTDSWQGVIYEINSLTGERNPLITPATTKSLVKRPTDVFLDSEKNRLVILDEDIDSLIAFDLTSNEASLMTEIHTNSLEFLSDPIRAITFDPQSDKIFASDYSSIVSIDADDGDKILFKQSSNNLVYGYSSAVYDSVTDILYAVEYGSKNIRSINLTSGKKSIVSGIGIPDFINIPADYSAMDLDEAGNQLIAVDASSGAIHGVDLLSGKRTLIAGYKAPNSGNIGSYSYLTDVDYDSANKRIFVVDHAAKSISQINLVTGAQTLITSPSVPNTNNTFMHPLSAAYDAANHRLLVMDIGLRALLQVDLSTGERTIISSNTFPNSLNPFDRPSDLQLNMDKNAAYVLDENSGKFIAIDLSTGERTPITSSFGGDNFIMDLKNDRAIATNSDSSALLTYDFKQKTSSLSHTAGTEFDFIYSMALDQTSNQIVVLDDDENILSVNKDNTEVKLIFDGGMQFSASSKILVNSDKQKSYVLDRESIYVTDIDTGETTLLIDIHSRGITEDISYTSDIALDASSDDLFLIGRNSESQNIVWKLKIADRSLTVFSRDETAPTDDERGDLKIVIDPSKNRLLALDEGRGSITAIDLNNGSRKILSDSSTPNAFNPILEVNDITLDTNRNRLLVNHNELPGLLSIDLETGERVYISR